MAVVFLPGIKASKLVDVYPLDHDEIWNIADFSIGSIFEDPMDLSLEGGQFDRPGHQVRPGELLNLAYGRLVKDLRRELDKSVYTFPYDWRRSCSSSAERLAEFVEYLYEKYGQEPVDIVTHSMGGLVARSALSLVNIDRIISRVVFIAPPFRGSCTIPEVLIAGQKNGLFSSRKAFRKLARKFPSVYELLPSFSHAIEEQHTGKELDIFKVANWQKNVVESDEPLRPEFLKQAATFQNQPGAPAGTGMLTDSEMNSISDKVIIAISSGHSTRRSIPVDTQNERNPNWFDFDSSISDKLGDEQVHLMSAAVKGVTLAIFEGIKDHGLVCRDEEISIIATQWLKKGKAIMIKPRRPINSVARPGKTFFSEWDGDPASFTSHAVSI